MASLVEGDGSNKDHISMAVKAWPLWLRLRRALHSTPYDLVGVYILALAAARGRSWSSVSLKARVAADGS